MIRAFIAMVRQSYRLKNKYLDCDRTNLVAGDDGAPPADPFAGRAAPDALPVGVGDRAGSLQLGDAFAPRARRVGNIAAPDHADRGQFASSRRSTMLTV